MIIQGMTLQEMANYLVNLSTEQLLKLGETNSVLRTGINIVLLKKSRSLSLQASQALSVLLGILVI